MSDGLSGLQTVQFSNESGVAVLTLNRPHRANALTQPMLDEIDTVLDAVEADDRVRVLVLRGAGNNFCGGFDLDEDAGLQGGVSAWRPLLQRDFDVTMRFWHLSKPTLSAVHGAAVGGGCSLALACDITVAARGSRFGEPELKFGSSSPVLLMPWLLNPKQAKELMFTANDRIDVEMALRLGLINRIVPEGQHFSATMEMATNMAVMDPEVMRMTKRAVHRSYEARGMREAMEIGLDVAVEIETLSSPDRQAFKAVLMREGLKAALQWRDGRFASQYVSSPQTI